MPSPERGLSSQPARRSMLRGDPGARTAVGASTMISVGKRSSSRVVGLDVQPGYVAAAEVSDEGSLRLRRVGVVDLDAGVVRDGEVVDVAGLASALRVLFAENGLPRRARVGVANQRVVIRTVDLPPLEGSELDAALRFQAPDLIPMPMDQAAWTTTARGGGHSRRAARPRRARRGGSDRGGASGAVRPVRPARGSAGRHRAAARGLPLPVAPSDGRPRSGPALRRCPYRLHRVTQRFLGRQRLGVDTGNRPDTGARSSGRGQIARLARRDGQRRGARPSRPPSASRAVPRARIASRRSSPACGW